MKKRMILSVCMIFSITGPHISFAQSGSASPQLPEQAIETAPVMIDDFLVLEVRGIRSFPAKMRANIIADRIIAIARDRNIKTESIKIVETTLSSDIVAGEEPIVSIYDVDASLERIDRSILARAYLVNIRKAVERYRMDRAPGRLFRAILFSLLYSAVFTGVLVLLSLVFRKTRSLLEARYKRKVQALEIQSLKIVRAEKIWAIITSTLRTLRFLLTLALVYAVLYLILGNFPWTRNLAHNLAAYVLQPLRSMGQGILAYTPNFIFMAVFIFAVRYILKLVRLFFSRIETDALKFRGFDSDWALPTYKIIRILFIVFSIVILYPYIPGADSPVFKGVSILVGLIVSLGSSTAISNIIAGYSMVYRRTFKLGDRVQVGDYVGEVVQMRLLVTHLMTPKHEELIVPNSLILNSPVINFSSIAREKSLILHTSVTIGYDTPWRQVEALLLQAADRAPGILKDPHPFVLQKCLDDFYVNHELNAYTNSPGDMPKIYSELHRNILDAFNEAGIQIMSPHYVADPAQNKVVPRGKWFPE